MDLSFLEQHSYEFQDLIDLGSNGGSASNAGAAVDGINVDIQIHKLEATSLTLTDVIGELERRGLQPKGFYSDDAKRLQRCFDEEHEEYVETKRKELLDAKNAEEEEKKERHKKTMMENEVIEEKKAIYSNSRTMEWFRLILSKGCPLESRIEVSNTTARSLAKALWSDSTIKSIDVSNMNLSDLSGAFLTRALKNNNTLVKLEMDGNNFGLETCQSLADSLLVNNSIEFLSIGSNTLIQSLDKNDHRSCVEQLAHAIAKNSGLICLSLWRCGIGLEEGKFICRAISTNKNLISVEVGYNNFDNADILLMNKQLMANRSARQHRLSQEAELLITQEKALAEQRRAEQSKQKEEQECQWLEKGKVSRAEARRLKLEWQQQRKQKEARYKLQMEHIQRLEEDRMKAASKKGKKKGKKK